MTDQILTELIQKQKKDVIHTKKLMYNDLKRVSKYLPHSIFTNDCCIWNGYITQIKNNEHNLYINFFFKGKKHALHRLLYSNFIGELNDSEYIKFNCPNKGKCCNIEHFHKIEKPDVNHESINGNESNKDNGVNKDDRANKNNEDKNKQITIISKPISRDIIVGFN